MTTCKNCGAELSDKDCFCPVCGNAISSEITVEEPTQVFDISKDDIENVNEDMPEKSQVNEMCIRDRNYINRWTRQS